MPAAGDLTRGVVTGIGYSYGFHPEATPANIALSLLAAGHPGPDFTKPFVLLEPGFGQGVTLALTAAVHPEAPCFGTDLNPDHASHCRGLAEAAGLDNLKVDDRPIAAWDPPPADLIIVHGVWSWVGPETRAELLRLIERRLKPGGVLYLAYNALPAWRPWVPLRDWMKRHVDASLLPLAQAIPAALQAAAEAAAAGHFPDDPDADGRIAALAAKPLPYLAHEFFNAHWRPECPAAVARELAPLGLVPVASASPADRIGVPDPERPFRRDLFLRLPAPALPRPPEPLAGPLRFAALADAERVPGLIRLADREVALDRPVAMAIMERLSEAPATVVDLAESTKTGPETALRALLGLTALGLAAPALPASDPAAAHRFNGEVLARAELGDTVAALAVPGMGGGVELSRRERLFLRAPARNAGPAGFAATLLGGDAGEHAEVWRVFAKRRLRPLLRLGLLPRSWRRLDTKTGANPKDPRPPSEEEWSQ